MTNFANKNWSWSYTGYESSVPNEVVTMALLQDIRNELLRLNQVMQCYRVLEIPNQLEAIKKNTSKPKRKKAKR